MASDWIEHKLWLDIVTIVLFKPKQTPMETESSELLIIADNSQLLWSELLEGAILYFYKQSFFALAGMCVNINVYLFSGRRVLLWNNPVWNHRKDSGRPRLSSPHRGDCSSASLFWSHDLAVLSLHVCTVHRLILLLYRASHHVYTVKQLFTEQNECQPFSHPF